MTALLEQLKTDNPYERAANNANSESSQLNLLAIVSDRPAQAHGAARPGAARPGAARHGRAANDEVMRVLKADVDHPMGRTPEWVPREMRNPDPRVQCASTASNIYREAMLASHVINSTDSPRHRDLTQVASYSPGCATAPSRYTCSNRRRANATLRWGEANHFLPDSLTNWFTASIVSPAASIIPELLITAVPSGRIGTIETIPSLSVTDRTSPGPRT